ncbi:hypothetical protein N1851_033481 [Merluccius polli]|uniref:Uncharacterized protein n=1 Tax=Merluccius polli TaxID=89951 RepID=A0AA47NNL1_MERPO|nr:hypothetical protein N1851_033481 [Merluccius polli]
MYIRLLYPSFNQTYNSLHLPREIIAAYFSSHDASSSPNGPSETNCTKTPSSPGAAEQRLLLEFPRENLEPGDVLPYHDLRSSLQHHSPGHTGRVPSALPLPNQKHPFCCEPGAAAPGRPWGSHDPRGLFYVSAHGSRSECQRQRLGEGGLWGRYGVLWIVLIAAGLCYGPLSAARGIARSPVLSSQWLVFARLWRFCPPTPPRSTPVWPWPSRGWDTQPLVLSPLCNILSGPVLPHRPGWTARASSRKKCEPRFERVAPRPPHCRPPSFCSLDVEMMAPLVAIAVVPLVCWCPFLVSVSSLILPYLERNILFKGNQLINLKCCRL